MKRNKSIGAFALVGIAALVLSACSSNDEPSANGTTLGGGDFDTVEMTTTPQWSLENLVPGSWGSGNEVIDTTIPTAAPDPLETGAPVPDMQDGGEGSTDVPEILSAPDDIFLQDQISFYDTSTQCRITGLIGFVESYKSARGDLYNSKDFLYSQVAPSQPALSGEKVTDINGTSYVVGDYTTPEEWGGDQYHRMAVRTFSSPVSLGDVSNFSENEFGNFHSDLSVGLPNITIHYSCPTLESLTDAQWDAGIKNFALIINPQPIQAPDVTVDPSTGNEPPVDNTVENPPTEPTEGGEVTNPEEDSGTEE